MTHAHKTFALALAGLLLIPAAASAVVLAPSNGGNVNLHAIGWQTFDNAGGDNNSGISDGTPESNSTFDSTPFMTTGGSYYLTGGIGGASVAAGRDGYGQNTLNTFLNGDTFGQTPGGGNGLFIVDVPNAADGSTPGSRVGPFGGAGTSSWKFRSRNGNADLHGDISITNTSAFSFRLERVHYDARAASANSPLSLDLIYLATPSNLINTGTGNEVADLKEIDSITFAGQGTQNVTQALAAPASIGSAVRLGPGDSAAFRFRWTAGLGLDAQSQLDNIAFSGTFFDVNGTPTNYTDDFAVNPVTVIPEPSRAVLVVIGFGLTMVRRKR